MSAIVYGNPVSTRSQRVLLVLEELGVEYDFKILDFSNGDHHASPAPDPAYVADHHPFAKVPAFEDDGVNMFESRAICRYLVAKYASDLSPSASDPNAVGLFEQAASVEYEYFEPAVARLGFELIFKGALGLGETNQNVVEEQRAQLSKVLDYYDSILSKRDFLAGKTYSLVDLFHAPWINFISHALKLSSEIDSRPNVRRWWGSVNERAATKKVLGK